MNGSELRKKTKHVFRFLHYCVRGEVEKSKDDALVVESYISDELHIVQESFSAVEVASTAVAVVLIRRCKLNRTQTNRTSSADDLLICEDPLALRSKCDAFVDGSRVIGAEEGVEACPVY